MGNGAVDGSRPWQVEGKAAVVDTADVADLTDMVGVSDVVYVADAVDGHGGRIRHAGCVKESMK